MSKALKLAQRRLKEIEKLNKAKLLEKEAKVYPPFVLQEFLFDKQLNFVNDPARFVVACCSVRSGKTISCCADMINTCIKTPRVQSIYITLARTSAKTICWPELKRIIADFGIQCTVNESDLTVCFPNDSWIRLYGGNEEKEIEKLRGLSNVALVYLDECQSFRQHIKQLVEDIIAKRLYDLNGKCRMIGTPGPIESGYFYDCTKSLGWSQHHWTMFDNPWLLKKSGKTPQELTDEDCRRRGVTLDDPSIQRENYGRWKQDPNALLLNYNREINDFDKLPKGVYNYILGIDLGQRDYNFLSVLAYSETSKTTYLVEERYKQGQSIDDLAKNIADLRQNYNIVKLVADAGGLGLAIVEELRQRHQIPIEAAKKTEKMSTYAIMNSALKNGTLKARSNTVFANDCNLLERDDEKSTPDKIVVKGHSDAVDACMYAFKLSPAYSFSDPVPKAVPGTPEHMKQFEIDVMEANMKRLEQQAKQNQGSEITWQTNPDGSNRWNSWDDF